MKRKTALILTLTALVALAFGLWRGWQSSGGRTFTIINIGNLQSQILPFSAVGEDGQAEKIGGVMHLKTAVDGLRAAHPDHVVVSPGDMVMGAWWRLFGGEPEFKSASALGVSVAAVGNHEFSLGLDYLKEAVAAYADFPILGTSFDSDEEFEAIFGENVIVTTKSGFKIGFFSLGPPLYSLSGPVKNMIEAHGDHQAMARRQIKILKKQGAEAVVLLSHLPVSEDVELAREVAGLNLIISGDNTLGGRAELKKVRGPGGWLTLLATGPVKGQQTAAVTLTVRRGGDTAPEGAVLETLKVDQTFPADPRLEMLTQGFEREIAAMLDRPIGIFAEPVDALKTSTRSGETPLGDFLTDALRWGTGADVAIMNAGGIRGDRIFPAGPVSIRNVYEIFPFHNTIWIKQMTGRQVRDMLSLSASALLGENDAPDSDTRLGAGGLLHFSGLMVTLALSEINPPARLDGQGNVARYGNRLKSVKFIDGVLLAPLNDGQTYTVAMPSYLAEGGDKYGLFKDLPGHDTQILDADIIIDYIKSHQRRPITMTRDGRLEILYGPGK